MQRPHLSTYDIEDDDVLRCMESQEMLGTESFLRGFPHIDRLHLLRDNGSSQHNRVTGFDKTQGSTTTIDHAGPECMGSIRITMLPGTKLRTGSQGFIVLLLRKYLYLDS